MNDQKENPFAHSHSINMYIFGWYLHWQKWSCLAGDRRYESCKHRTDHMTDHPYPRNIIQYLPFIRTSRGSVAIVTESTSRSSDWPWRNFLAGKVYTRAIPTYGVQSDHSPHTGAPVSDSPYGRLPRSHVSVATHTISWSVTRAHAASHCYGQLVKLTSAVGQLVHLPASTPRILLPGIPTNIWSPFLGRFPAWRVSGRAGPPPHRPPSPPALHTLIINEGYAY